MTETIYTSKQVAYIGNIGWSTNTKHIVWVQECKCDKFEGTHSHSSPWAACKPNTGMHYRIGPVTQVRHTAPTAENITCKACLKILEERKV